MRTYLSGHAYGGRSLANWSSHLRASQLARAIETLEALNSLFPPCSGDTLSFWADNGVELGLVTRNERILIAAFKPELDGWFGTRFTC